MISGDQLRDARGRAGLDWPASWHRAVCARLADEVPGLRIGYWG